MKSDLDAGQRVEKHLRGEPILWLDLVVEFQVEGRLEGQKFAANQGAGLPRAPEPPLGDRARAGGRFTVVVIPLAHA